MLLRNIFILFNLIFCLTHFSQAEVVLDGTLGHSRALAGPDYQVDGHLGQQQGDNLFHSFQSFNLYNGETITFSGPDHINHVINRVTGGHPSEIDGTLRNTMPRADFYLINPAGLLFGPNATLDMPGAFHASTADTLYLQEDGEFNASTPNNSALTAAPPAAFGFLSNAPAALTAQGSQLTVPERQQLSLVGGDITVEQRAQLTAAFGRVNLASVAESGNVAIQKNNLTAPPSRGDMTLKDAAITLDGEGSGALFVRAGRFVLDNTDISMKTKGAADGLAASIEADELTAINGGNINSVTWGAGKGSDVHVKVKSAVALQGANPDATEATQVTSGIYAESGDFLDPASAANQFAGDSGNIILNAGKLRLSEGGQISSSTFSATGQGGEITVKVAGPITISGQLPDGSYASGLFSVSQNMTEAQGEIQGGTIQLEAAQLNITQGGEISTFSFGAGSGGDIHVKVAGEVLITGRFVSAAGEAGAPSRMMSAAFQDQAGQIRIDADHINIIEEGRVVATVVSGQAGVVHLQAQNILINNGIIAVATVDGQAGDISLKANTLVAQDDALITAESLGTGQGGNVKIEVDRIYLSDKSTLLAAARSSGDAGRIVITAKELLRIQNGFIQTQTKESDGGDISLNSKGYLYLVHSEMTTSVRGDKGDGGNMEIKPNFVVLDDSRIQANAFEGDGGNISITATGLYEFSQSVIEASSRYGLDGEVVIKSPDINVSGQLVILSSKPINVGQLPAPCRTRNIENTSSFQKVQREGLPTPYDHASSGAQLLNANMASTATTAPTKKIQVSQLDLTKTTCSQ